MTFEQLITIITSVSPLTVVKLSILLLILLYIAFTFIIIRQVDLMGKTVTVPLTPLLKFFAVLHFLASIGLFVLSLVIL